MDIRVLVRAPNKPEKTVLVKKDVVIGRSQTCQLRVLSNEVSREHCRLIVGENTVAVRDLGSANGTLVDGRRIPADSDVNLKSGNAIAIGPLQFVVQFDSPSADADAKLPDGSAKQDGKKSTKSRQPKSDKSPQAKRENGSASSVPSDDTAAAGAAAASAIPGLLAAIDADTEPAAEFDLSELDAGDEGATIHILSPMSASGPISSGSESEAQADHAVEFSPAVAESTGTPFFNELTADAETQEASVAIDVDTTTNTSGQNASSATDDKPGKLKSLFGLFRRGKQDAPAGDDTKAKAKAGTVETATDAELGISSEPAQPAADQAEQSVPETVASSETEPAELPFSTPAADEDSDLSDFLKQLGQ